MHLMRKLLLPALVVALLIFGAGSAGASSGTITNVSVDSYGHITVSWTLNQPSSSLGSMFADYICIGGLDPSNPDPSSCTGKEYSPTMIAPGGDSYYGLSGSFTTPDTFAPGAYSISLLGGEVDAIYTDDYLNDGCSVDMYGTTLFICAIIGPEDWMTPVTFTVPDTQAPVASGINKGWVTSTAVQMSFTASDDVGVTSYRIYRNSQVVATTATPYFIDTGLTPSTNYNYQFVALDAAGNASPLSSMLTVTTLATPCVVPNVLSTYLNAATAKLQSHNCSLGHVTKVKSRRQAHLVVAQHYPPGAHLAHGAKVNLTISSGLK